MLFCEGYEGVLPDIGYGKILNCNFLRAEWIKGVVEVRIPLLGYHHSIVRNKHKALPLLNAIIFDLDGTLANITHRLHFINKGVKDWDSFFKAIPEDQPIVEMVDLAITLIAAKNKPVIFATGRPERTRNDTITWLQKNGIDSDFQSMLFMRQDGNRRPDYIIKQNILEDLRRAGYEPDLVFDDRQSVVDMWREQGVRVAQVAPGKF